MNDSGGQGRYDEGEEAVAEHADALEERHAAAEQLGVHRHDCCPAPRDDEDGAEHEAAVVLRGERRVELVGRGALAREKDGQGEAQDEGAPQVPVLQLSASLQQRVSLRAQCVVVVCECSSWQQQARKAQRWEGAGGIDLAVGHNHTAHLVPHPAKAVTCSCSNTAAK